MLLDTHVWLWLNSDPERLPVDVLERLRRRPADGLVSAASSWEITIKVATGRLELPEPPPVWIPDRLRRNQLTALPVEHSHSVAVFELPPHHRDPFDRLLVAQARVLGVPIVTADVALERYDIETITV